MPGLKALTDRLAPGDSSRAVTLYTSSFSFGVGLSFLVSQLVAEAWGWRSRLLGDGAGPAGDAVGLLPVAAGRRRSPRRDACWISRRCFATPMRWDLFSAMAHIALNFTASGPGWSRSGRSSAMRNRTASILTPVVVSVLFSVLAMPASISRQRMRDLKFGRHRAITAVMLSSAAVALLIGAFADKSPWLLLPLVLVYAITVPADSGALTSGMTMAADPNYRGATMAVHSTVGFSLSALGAWALGVALDAAGGPSSATAWTAAFSVLGGRHSAWTSGALLVQSESIAGMSSTRMRKAKHRGKRLLPFASGHDWTRFRRLARKGFVDDCRVGIGQTIAWASSYYLPAILAAPIARDLGISPTFVYRRSFCRAGHRGLAGSACWALHRYVRGPRTPCCLEPGARCGPGSSFLRVRKRGVDCVLVHPWRWHGHGTL